MAPFWRVTERGTHCGNRGERSARIGGEKTKLAFRQGVKGRFRRGNVGKKGTRNSSGCGAESRHLRVLTGKRGRKEKGRKISACARRKGVVVP